MLGFLSVDAVKSNQHVGLSLRTLFKIVKIGCISRKCCTPVHSSAANWVEKSTIRCRPSNMAEVLLTQGAEAP
jgi:hypothetical protein